MKRTNICTFRAAALLKPVVVAAFVHFGLAAETAHAHGDADWIKRGGYRDRDGSHCCGKDDCHRLAPAEVHESPGGFNLFGRFIPRAEARPSEDGQYWACYSMFKFRCFFYPAPRF